DGGTRCSGSRPRTRYPGRAPVAVERTRANAATRCERARDNAGNFHSRRCLRHPYPPSTLGPATRRRSLVFILEQPQARAQALRRLQAEVQVSVPRDHAASSGAHEKTLLNQKRLDDILERAPLLADGHRETVDSHRAAIELLDDGQEQL